MDIDIDIHNAAAAMGRKGGKANKGIPKPKSADNVRKVSREARAANAAKARAAKAAKRAAEK